MYKSKSKYNAKKVEIDGIKFDSKKEANRYCELKLLEKAGEILSLELQPRFRVVHGFKYKNQTIRPVDYTADFRYFEKDGTHVVEEVKGMKTRDYIIRKKLFLRDFGQVYDFREL